LGAAVLALGGCGRKGGLDLPPNASAEATAAAQANADHEPPSQPSLFNPNYGTDAPPTAPGKGPKRSIILDPLLNSN
jgi:predicted small lipoprotein YifL